MDASRPHLLLTGSPHVLFGAGPVQVVLNFLAQMARTRSTSTRVVLVETGPFLFSENMATMGPISRAISRAADKLPKWAKLICVVFLVLGSVYYIAHYGFFSFLLRMIFSPVP
jgi:hypothetical protein